MARVNHQGQYNVINGRTWQIKVLRGSATRMTVNIQNAVGGTGNYFVQEIGQWDSHLDEIMGVVGAVPYQRSVALGALDYIPMHDGLYTNQGQAGGVAVFQAGVLVNTNPWYPPESNQINQQLANGYIRIRAGSTFCTYNGPFTVGMWIYPTLVSALTPIWSEQNAGVSHYLQVFLDTDRRIGFRGTNGVTTFSVKDAAGPQVALNQWTLVVVNYSTPNYQYFLFTPFSTGSASTPTTTTLASIPTFVDASGTYVGLIGGISGYFSAPFSFNNTTYNQVTTAPLTLTAMQMLANEWSLSYNSIMPIDSGTLAIGGKFTSVYGTGSAKAFPPVVVIGVSIGGADSAGMYTISIERDD